MDPTCINSSYTAQYSFSAGEQYNDSNNGLLYDKWFMLSRWQANEQDFISNGVVYDVGNWTGLHSAPYQRGVTPETSSGSAAVQLSCYDSGMLVNTWTVPHRPIVGGGYNDMIGYSFSAANRPYPFTKNGLATDLVLQSSIAVPWYSTTHRSGTNNPMSGQVGLYVYLRDMANPSFPPIVVLAMSHMSNLIDYSLQPGTNRGQQYGFLVHGNVSWDYASADTNAAKTAYPYWLQNAPWNGSGVWFTSAPISSSNDQRYITKVYSAGDLNSNLVPLYDLGAPLTFWRAHITPANLGNIVADINGVSCSACPPRPSGGYSNNPNNWVMEYAGVITEVTLSDGLYDVSRTNWGGMPGGSTPYADTTKDQISIGAHAYAPGIYRYYP